MALAYPEMRSVFVPAVMHLDELELLPEQRVERMRDAEAIGHFVA